MINVRVYTYDKKGRKVVESYDFSTAWSAVKFIRKLKFNNILFDWSCWDRLDNEFIWRNI